MKNLLFSLPRQRGVRHGDAAERGHQEVEPTLPERHPRQASLQRIQADEISQSQKCKWSTECVTDLD